jgi:predicted O-methyltransferase YrrM
VKHQLKSLGKTGLRKLFEAGQRLGFDLLPRHFYSEIPDIRELRNSQDWRKPYTMVGVNGAAIAGQMEFVRQCCPPELVERQKRGDIHERACRENGAVGYGPIEADFLHSFVVTHRPRRVVQVGCGVTTAIILAAAAEAGYEVEVTCVDPYPTEYLRRAGKAGRIKLIAERAELQPFERYTDLGAGDLLFIDSTHTLRPGNEVSRVILEVLPRLKPGVHVHFHDIIFPYDYGRGVLTHDLFFGHESVLLHAFLTNNAKYSILAALSMLHYADPEGLKTFLPNYRPARNEQGLEIGEGHFPSAIYLQVIA